MVQHVGFIVTFFIRYVTGTYLIQVRAFRDRICSKYVLFTRTSQVSEKVKKVKKVKKSKKLQILFLANRAAQELFRHPGAKSETPEQRGHRQKRAAARRDAPEQGKMQKILIKSSPTHGIEPREQKWEWDNVPLWNVSVPKEHGHF